jgi:hypothetical protein
MHVMRKLFAAIAAATMVMAACGGDDGGSSGGSPKETLTSAVENLSSGGHTITLSLNSDPESLAALSEGSFNEDVASKILDSSISISSNGEDNPADSEFALAANIAGNTDFEVRFVDETLYLRIDLDSLLDLAGPEAKAEATQQIQAAIEAAKAQGLDFVEPAANGEWLAFTGLTGLLDQLGVNPSPSEDQQAVLDQFTAAVTKDAEVTSEGTDDEGEHLVASANLKNLYQNFVDLATELNPSAASQLGAVDASEIPDEEVSVDFWVNDGSLTQIQFDFLQLAGLGDEEIPDGVDALGLRLEIDDFSGGVEVPSGATEVDVAQLLQTFMGGLSGTGSDTSGGSDSGTDAFCDALKGQPKSVQKAYADQCPDL